jgi:hypothetical protein
VAGAWPDLPTVRAFLRLQPDPKEDAIIDAARVAAIEYGVSKYGKVDDGTGTGTMVDRYPVDSTTVPDSGRQAATMHSARLYRRRDSVDGTIAFGDMGAIRVGRVDADIEALYGLFSPLVFG